MSDRLAYSIQEAAEAIGVARETVERLIHEGYLIPWRCGRLIRIRRTDLEALLTVDLPSVWADQKDKPFPEHREGYERPEVRQ